MSDTASNTGSRNTVKFTAPSNSRSIRAISSATCRRLFPVISIALSTDRVAVDGREKSSRIVDKRGEVAGLRVERAIGIQSRLPPVQPTLKSTSSRFWSLEKSKDRSKASHPPTLGDSVSVNTLHPRTGYTWRRSRTHN